MNDYTAAANRAAAYERVLQVGTPYQGQDIFSNNGRPSPMTQEDQERLAAYRQSVKDEEQKALDGIMREIPMPAPLSESEMNRLAAEYEEKVTEGKQKRPRSNSHDL